MGSILKFDLIIAFIQSLSANKCNYKIKL